MKSPLDPDRPTTDFDIQLYIIITMLSLCTCCRVYNIILASKCYSFRQNFHICIISSACIFLIMPFISSTGNVVSKLE